MISNERPSPFGGVSRGPAGERPHVQEDTIKTTRIQIERKVFVFALKENPRGRFLRITEDVGGRRDTIIIPAPGLEEFRGAVEEMIHSLEADTETETETEIGGESESAEADGPEEED